MKTEREKSFQREEACCDGEKKNRIKMKIEREIV
jgi:hypothetical protein